MVFIRKEVHGRYGFKHYEEVPVWYTVTGQLADTPTRGLDDSRTRQLADAIGDFACLVFLFGGICETASCPVRELAIRELAYPRVVQLPGIPWVPLPLSLLDQTPMVNGLNAGTPPVDYLNV